MCVEHEVWAVPPGEKEPEFFMSFDLDRWQWAQKLAKFLDDKGYTGVEVRLNTGYDEPEHE